MRKNLTKTILLIVFVVFFGMKKVEAADVYTDVYKTCVYEGNNGESEYQYLMVSVSKSMAAKILYDNREFNDETQFNWIKATAPKEYTDLGIDVYGSQFFSLQNGYMCPPKVVVSIHPAITGFFYSDDDPNHVEQIRKMALNYRQTADQVSGIFGGKDNAYVYSLVGFSVNEPALKEDADVKNGTLKKITPKTCECVETEATNVKKLKVTINIGADLVSGRYTFHATNQPIANWNRKWDFSNGFSLVDHLLKTDSCPDYLMSNLGLQLHFADTVAATLQMRKKNPNVHLASCVKVDSDSDEEEPSQQPEYEEPGVVQQGTLSESDNDYSCGAGYISSIPGRIINIVHLVYMFIQVLIPLALIILGSIDLVKAVAGQKEDEIKKGQQIFVKRLVEAIIVFFVFAIIKFLISIVSNQSENIISCLDCFLEGTDSSSCVVER